MSNLKKHNILKQLKIYFDTKTQESLPYTILGKSMSIEQLHSITKYTISDITIICKSLQKANLICPITYAEEKHIQRYYINDLGEIALFDEYFISSLWYKDWKFLIPLLISILAFLVPILLSKDNTETEAKISKMELQIKQLTIEQWKMKSKSLQ